jgi:L-ascorbate metabolism protein UlaG (beta-lactamase superfamily)
MKEEKKIRITWYGTACFGLEYGKDRILFDPFLELAGGSYAADLKELMAYDTIFVTHCHFDHLYTAEQLLEEGDGEISVFCTRQCCDTLERFLEDQSNVVQIDVGRSYNIGSISIDVLKGRHIEFQRRHILDTMTPARMIRYAGNLPFLFWANRIFQEAGESVAFLIRAGTKKVLLLGSLSMEEKEQYPEGVDVLILPYQGNNDLPARAGEVLGRLRPKSVLLSHFDNAFPPMSRNVDLRPLGRMMRRDYPGIRIVKPAAGKTMEL